MPGKSTRYAIAQIGQIRGTRPKIPVLGSGIIRDLSVESAAPSIIRRHSGIDLGKRGRGQIRVLEQGKLELENGGGLARLRRGEPPEGGRGAGNPPPERRPRPHPRAPPARPYPRLGG